MAKIARPIGSENLTSRSINLIIDLIRNGQLKRGDRLPPQDELARQLGVSRTALREALKELSYRGIIASRHGCGTYVSDMLVEEEETLEARLIIEPRMTLLAATRAAHPELQELRDLCGRMDGSVKARDRLGFSEQDTAFHSAIARMSHNKALSMLLASVRDMMLHQQNVVHVIPGAMERAHLFHLEIARAMEEHQAEAARTAMQRHLEDVMTTLQAYRCQDRYAGAMQEENAGAPASVEKRKRKAKP